MRLSHRMGTVVSILILSASVARAQTGAAPSGHWEGKIQIPNHEVSTTVDLTRTAAGVWVGSMTVTGSSSIDVPLANIIVDGRAVQFAADLPARASFTATLSVDGNSLSGTASSREGTVPFQLARSGQANVKVPPPSSTLSKEFAGKWEGVLDAGGKTRRVLLTVSAAPDGTAVATLTSEKGLEIAVTTVTIKDKELQLEARAVSGTYRGTLGANGEVAGEWTEASTRAPLTFKREGAAKAGG